MEQKEKIKSLLKSLFNLSYQMMSGGGKYSNKELYDRYLALKTTVLEKFGLPGQMKMKQIFEIGYIPTDKEIDVVYEFLTQEATEYLLKSTQSPLELLKEAVELNLDYDRVLSELGFTHSYYNYFVYNEILLTEQDYPENVLEVLRIANEPKHNDMLEAILFKSTSELEKTQRIAYLKSIGIQYIDLYLQYFAVLNNHGYYSRKMNHFFRIINNDIVINDYEDVFKYLATQLMSNLCLSIDHQEYRIVEVEIYYYDEKKHPDPYVHRTYQKLYPGHWYFSSKGLEITCGHIRKGIYGSILIRGLAKVVEMNSFISGPMNVVSEIFTAMGPAFYGTTEIHFNEFHDEFIKILDKRIVQSPRVDLQPIDADNAEEYRLKPYRYIMELNPYHNFQDKEKIVRQMVQENELSPEEANEVLGYDITF